MPRNKINPLTIKRLYKLICFEPFSGCWLWNGRLNKDGYGRTADDKLAHRVSYTLLKGAIPDGLELDHLCRVRCCVSPDHLEPVTQAENFRRSMPNTQAIRKWTADRAARTTHCPYGHEYSAENTFLKRGMRNCRECHRRRNRKSHTDKSVRLPTLKSVNSP